MNIKGLVRIERKDPRVIIDRDKLKELVEKGLKDSEVAVLLNVKEISVWSARKRWNITREPIRGGRVKLTERQWNIIAGSLLGDMSFNKVNTSAYGKSEYSSKFKPYLLWMYEELYPLCGRVVDTARFDERTKKTYYASHFHIRANPELNQIYESTYINKKKVISPYLLEKYNELSLAVHFMDDGFKTYSGYMLATECFPVESIELFRSFLKDRFGLHSSVHRKNNLYIPAASRHLFEHLINPYLLPIMRYKLVSRNSVNSVEP